MRQFDKTAVINEELHDLKLRFELLEGDRKAYYETSQWAIRRNKEEVNHLRVQNKHLSDSIARIKKSEIEVHSNRFSMTELDKFDHKICEVQKKYDELQAEARAKEDKLRGLVDRLADLKLEADMVNSNMKDSPQAKGIRMLENRLDKAMIKYNEAQSIYKTYEQIVKRLQDERLSFDNQLENFEKTLKAKKQEASELEMMSRDANHSKDVAKAELSRFEQQVNEELNDKLDRKIAKLDEQNTDASGNLEDKELYDEATENKMIEYEETMRLIKEVTGVSDINEVIAKFQSQGATHEHLTLLQKANAVRLTELKTKKTIILAEFEELKYSGEAKHSNNIRLVEEFEKHLSDSLVRTEDARIRFERIAKTLTNAKSGVQHLADKLESIRLSSAPTKSEAVTDTNVAQILQICIRKLENLAVSLHGKELPEMQQTQPIQPQQPPGEPTNILHVNVANLPQFNTRIKLRPVEFEDVEMDDEDEIDDEYGEVPDRETIKKHTTQMLNARLKTKQPKKIRKKRAAKEEEDSS
ncbi:hypothetical protein BASA61_005665 [Batrachochytrium salamandrivorans]|nr:hypothetical protein BASA61_005665 [Batrachochytrium salamandrivorans]